MKKLQILHDVESKLVALWTNKLERENFLAKKVDTESEIDKRGVRVYAELVNIGRQDLMLSVYPGCARLIGRDWEDTVTDYFEKFPPDHYRLNNAASRFSDYLTKFAHKYTKKFPYLAELADYEWIELQLMEDDRDIVQSSYAELSTPDKFEKFAPVVNPVLVIREYNYPVPLIVDYLRDGELPRNISPKDAIVAIYRDPETHLCRYVEIKKGIEKIIEQALSKPTSYADLAAFACCNSEDKPEIVIVDFIEAVEKLRSLNLFVGSVIVG